MLRKEASYDFYGTGTRNARTGVRGYDLATRLGSVLPLTRQTASIETRGLVEIVEQNFGFEPENGVTTVTLDPLRRALLPERELRTETNLDAADACGRSMMNKNDKLCLRMQSVQPHAATEHFHDFFGK